MYIIYIYVLRSEVGVLEREHAVKVESLCVPILLYICVLIPLHMRPHTTIYMCPRIYMYSRMLTYTNQSSMLLTKPLCC